MSDSKPSGTENQDIDVRQRLLKLGYHIIPNRCKIPAAAGWNTPEYLLHELSDGPKGRAAERVASWKRRFPDALTTGLRIEDGLCVIDIDVEDQQFVDNLFDRIAEINACAGEFAPLRVRDGSFKIAIFARLAADCQPFVRLASRRYQGQCVEIFGGKKLKGDRCSRQFSIYGPHSDGVTYEWLTLGLAERDISELPALSREEIYAILDAADALACARGWSVDAGHATESADIVYDITEATRFDTNTGGVQISYAELCDEYAMHGDALRCSANFMPGRGSEKTTRCLVGNANRHRMVAVFVPGDEVLHFPTEADGEDAIKKAGALIKALAEATGAELMQPYQFRAGISLRDFYAFLPSHKYIYRHTGDLWKSEGVNAILRKVGGVSATAWLDRNQPITQMSWVPGKAELIPGYTTTSGGWAEVDGACIYNKYRPPTLLAGNGNNAGPWLDLIAAIYPEHVDHIVAFCAHRIQRPAEKINHALVLTGMPGLGKDTLLEPLKHGVGAWNFKEVAPHNVFKGNNDFMEAVVLRISETHDLGDLNRYAFYERCKTLLASPPDMVRVNVKYVPEYYVPNIAGVIFTTNYGADGLYLAADDRRHYVCGTELVRSDESDARCFEIWKWYETGGINDIVAYLRELDLSGFDAKVPPLKTSAFWRMVDTGTAPEVSELRDAIDALGNPDAVTIEMIGSIQNMYELRHWLEDRKNRRVIPHRMESCGYLPTRNPDRDDGLWAVTGKRMVIYAKRELTISQRQAAAAALREKKGNIIPFR